MRKMLVKSPKLSSQSKLLIQHLRHFDRINYTLGEVTEMYRLITRSVNEETPPVVLLEAVMCLDSFGYPTGTYQKMLSGQTLEY